MAACRGVDGFGNLQAAGTAEDRDQPRNSLFISLMGLASFTNQLASVSALRCGSYRAYSLCPLAVD